MSRRLAFLLTLLALALWPGHHFSPLGVTLGFAAQQTLCEISGEILDAGSRQPREGVRVLLLGTTWETTTDATGRYRFTQVPPGSYRIRVILSETQAFTLEAGTITEQATLLAVPPFFAEEVDAESATIDVTASAPLYDPSASVSKNTLAGEQVSRTPGGLEDVARVLGTMPGVVQESSFTSLLYIRGGDASETLSYLDGLYMGGTEHFGSLFTVFNNDLIREVDFYAGGFPARYVNVLSGVIDVHYRSGRTDRFAAKAEVSLLSSKLTLEGPLGRGGHSYLVGLRRTYVDAVLNGSGLASGEIIVPYFGDYYGKLRFRLGDRDILEAVTLFTEDGAEVQEFTDDTAPDQPPGKGKARDEQILTGLRWQHLFGADKLWTNQVFYNGRWLRGDLSGSNPYSARVRGQNGVWLSDLKVPHGKGHVLRTGLIGSYFKFQLKALIDDFATEISGGNTQLPTTVESKIYLTPGFDGWFAGAYVEDELRLTDSGVTLLPGVRADYWYYNEEWAVSPRLALSVPVTPKWALKASTGLYRQFPTDILEVDKDYGNPDLGSERAVHAVLGVEGLLAEHMKLRVETWHKWYDDLIMNFDDGEQVAAALQRGEPIFRNDGEGTAYGVDVFWQKRLSRRWEGYLSYGLAWVRRYNPLHTANSKRYYPQQDQRHTLSAVAHWDPFEKWRFSFKFQYRSGRPYTPITGWLLETHPIVGTPVWEPVYGDVNSARFPGYHSLDVRVERIWRKPRATWSLFADFTNLYSAKNLYNYSYDAGDPQRGIPPRRTPVHELPFLPFLGFSVEL